MIKCFTPEMLDDIMSIWLNTNKSSHDFISQTYWEDNYELVKTLLPQSSLFVYEEDSIIRGFIGIVEEGYIAGIFVAEQWQGNGYGRKLLEYCQNKYNRLSLDVYPKNSSAILFYERNGFYKQSEMKNPDTNEKEFHLVWEKPE